jgi:hypothetical protein
MNLFSITPELRIGNIVEVSGNSIRIELDGKISELTRTYNGIVYPIGQFASIIKIHYGRQILFAYVKLLRMRSEIEREEGRLPLPTTDDSRVIDADLFGEGFWNENKKSFNFLRGVRNYPLPGQSVYLTTQDELQQVYQGCDHEMIEGISPLIPLGNYVGAESTTCYANLDKLLNMHCAILGSTGSGKSGTVAALIHSILEHKIDNNGESNLRPRIILIDPHGEYAKAFGNKCIVYRAYNVLAEEADQSTKLLRLPYWIMTGEEIRDLIIGKSEWEATSENNIVYKALRHSRLHHRGWIEESKEWVGETAKATFDPSKPRPVSGDYQSKISEYDRDNPDPFSLDEFLSHIVNEQGIRIKTNKWDPMSPSDFKSHSSVIDKLGVLRTDPRLNFMMENYSDGDPDLSEILEQFIGNVDLQKQNKVDIRIIDISGLPNEVAGPLTASIARLLLQYKIWQTREERERDPLLIICEEAHRYVPDTGLAEYKSAQKAIRRIAKEGRKYGVGLILVSQRPADVERTVLSQCNTWIVMRLTNTADQEHVNRFLPDSLIGLSRLLPSLSRREAIFVGEAAAVPARIIIRHLSKDKLPESDDISFVNGWSKPPIERKSIQDVVKRWRRE